MNSHRRTLEDCRSKNLEAGRTEAATVTRPPPLSQDHRRRIVVRVHSGGGTSTPPAETQCVPALVTGEDRTTVASRVQIILPKTIDRAEKSTEFIVACRP